MRNFTIRNGRLSSDPLLLEQDRSSVVQPDRDSHEREQHEQEQAPEDPADDVDGPGHDPTEKTCSLGHLGRALQRRDAVPALREAADARDADAGIQQSAHDIHRSRCDGLGVQRHDDGVVIEIEDRERAIRFDKLDIRLHAQPVGRLVAEDDHLAGLDDPPCHPPRLGLFGKGFIALGSKDGQRGDLR